MERDSERWGQIWRDGERFRDRDRWGDMGRDE